jgi:hypothetical protein
MWNILLKKGFKYTMGNRRLPTEAASFFSQTLKNTL